METKLPHGSGGTNVAACAAVIAARAHAGQFRRDGITPYIRHPEAVVQRVSGDERAEAVAWLHDVLEDTTVTEMELRAGGIPQDVITAVRLLTKPDDAVYEEYLADIKANSLARKVKIADMLANLSDTPSDKQIVKYAKGLLILFA